MFQSGCHKARPAITKKSWGGGANLPIVSVRITTFYSFARSLLSAVSQIELYCHGYS